jgi:hypothetical protein
MNYKLIHMTPIWILVNANLDHVHSALATGAIDPAHSPAAEYDEDQPHPIKG